MPHVVEVENACAQAVFEVGAQVGYFIGKVDELGFEWRELSQEVFSEFRVALSRIIPGVFDDALSDAEGEVESTKGRIAFFKAGDDAKGMKIVIESQMMGTESLVESLLPGMPEWRMTDVVDERESLCERRIEAECAGCGAGDLSNFQGMGEAASRVIALCAPSGEHLRLTRETTKGLGMKNAPNVADEWRTVRMIGL